MTIGTLRRLVIFGALVLSIVAAVAVNGDDDPAAEVVDVAFRESERARPANSGTEGRDLGLDRLGRRDPSGTEADPFKTVSWYVAPPPPPPEPPAAPTAPPLPFSYMGKFEEIGADGVVPVYYFAKGNESFSVRPGDRLGSDYRFEKAERGNLIFTYLPLSITQRLPLGTVE